MESTLATGEFEVHLIKEVFEEENTTFKVTDVLSEISLEDLKSEIPLITLDEVSSDLCNFYQSDDLNELAALPPTVRQFLNFLKTRVRTLVEDLFHVATQMNITATVSKYTKGDFLLCHDDLMNNRAVAFVYYLNDLSEGEGGSLCFFPHDRDNEPMSGCNMRIIPPEENSLVLFRVNELSHHEVKQVLGDRERISINGWFHYEQPQSAESVIFVNRLFKSQILPLTMTMETIRPSREIISRTFLNNGALEEMGKTFKSSPDLAIVIQDALQEQFYNECTLELQDYWDSWEIKGPANFRFYETLPFEVEGPHISFGESFFNLSNLVDYLLGPEFMSALTKITGAEYAVYEDTRVPPTCMLEVQRWKEGHYSLLSDNNVEREMPTIEVTIFFRVNQTCIGSVSSGDNSGLIVRGVKPEPLSKSQLKVIYQAKWNRICKWYDDNHRRKISKRQRDTLGNRIDSVIEAKLGKLQKYRKSAASDTTKLTPENNCMLITYGSSTLSRYTGYIRRNPPYFEPQLCYYAVSVTYFVT